MNVQHAVNLSDALAAAIAEVQISAAHNPVGNLTFPVLGPIREQAENPWAIVPFQPQDHVTPEAIYDEPESSTSAARKRRRQTPVSVGPLRRSPRNNKYQGFKQQLITDRTSRKSHVKPAKTLTIEPMPAPESAVIPVSNNMITRNDEEDQVPPPTPVQVLQHVAVNLCGVPEEEVTQELLQAPSGDEDDTAA
jgi:hypothetical protein